MEKQLQRFGTLCLLLLVACIAKAQGNVTALWDFQHVNPSTLKTEAAIQKKTGNVTSTVSNISMYVDATSGKLQQRESDAQFNSGTKLRIPVKSAKDTVTVTSYSHSFTVGGTAATADVTVHRATTAEAKQGYVEIVATGNDYLYSIKVVQVSMIQEKELFATDFSDWAKAAAAKTESAVKKQTKYTHEALNFALFDVAVDPAGSNNNFKNGEPLGWLQAAKSDDPYITTSKLASITRVHFVHGATGKNRGYILSAKGDGDADWVVISKTPADPAGWCEVNDTINRTNCQLRFTNLNATQNAYMFQLNIYGNVDMSKMPALGTFDVNGTTYQAADVFDEQSDGTMTTTIEIPKKQTLVSATNPMTNIIADNGDVSEVTYVTKNDTTVATFSVTANEQTITYKATFVFKPDFTLTYYNTDGNVIGTQKIEKDATISEFAYTVKDVTVADGKAFRGWFKNKSGGRKYAVSDVITGNINLYGLATDIETESTSARYFFNLKDLYFYDEDHEAFNLVGTGKFHDNQHGWQFAAGDKVNLLVGGHAFIILHSCKYGSVCTLTLNDASGNVVGTANYPATNDGDAISFEYTGEAGVLTLTTNGAPYLHDITIDNIKENPVTTNDQGYYVVKAGNVNNLLTVLDIANAKASATERTYIFVPDGTYDMGNVVLTPISGSNISLIGQSMAGTIIKNAPEIEGIGVTATFLISGNNTYIQDMTIQDALDYYNSGAAGRAVCIQDRGTNTICKNVRLLSYQDTYYSNNSTGKFYWETSEIHGLVDFICGNGDAFFNKCLLVGESRSKTPKTGDVTLTAPYTDNSNWGYVFNNCTIENKAATFNFGRSWGGKSHLAYINTTINQPTEIDKTRFTAEGMNTIAYKFVEYNSIDANGTVVSPASNIVKFFKDKTVNEMETIINAEQAKSYSIDSVFTDWEPDVIATQKVMGSLSYQNNTISWDAVDGAKAYAIFTDGILLSITNTTSLAIAQGDKSVYTVRAANSMGGFGEASSFSTGIKSTVNNGNALKTQYYSADGMRISSPNKGINIRVRTYDNGGKTVDKVIMK